MLLQDSHLQRGLGPSLHLKYHVEAAYAAATVAPAAPAAVIPAAAIPAAVLPVGAQGAARSGDACWRCYHRLRRKWNLHLRQEVNPKPDWSMHSYF